MRWLRQVESFLLSALINLSFWEVDLKLSYLLVNLLLWVVKMLCIKIAVAPMDYYYNIASD